MTVDMSRNLAYKMGEWDREKRERAQQETNTMKHTKVGHTSGPWTWKRYRDSWDILGPQFPNGTGWAMSFGGLDSHEESEMDSNARLIAAAPDMYEAVKAMLEAFADEKKAISAIKKGWAALSKVEGE